MYLDQRFAVDYPNPDYSLEFAARLLAACPSALANLKTPKEIFDKVVELEKMFHSYTYANPLDGKKSLAGLDDWPPNNQEKKD
jgi:hypothetical protein